MLEAHNMASSDTKGTFVSVPVRRDEKAAIAAAVKRASKAAPPGLRVTIASWARDVLLRAARERRNGQAA